MIENNKYTYIIIVFYQHFELKKSVNQDPCLENPPNAIFHAQSLVHT